MRHKLKEVLGSMGITQKALAEKTGLTEVGVSKMVNSGTASKSSLEKIAEALEVDFERISDGEVVLKAKYEGELHIGDKILSCAVLSDNTRILSASAVFEAFDRPRKGRSSEGYRVDLMPSFINANNLQPFVSQQLKEWTRLISYTDIKGVRRQGYNARILAGLCKVYIDARKAGALLKSQMRFADIAEAILYALSDVGIIALVDEATGYDKAKERGKDELQKFLKMFLQEEAAKWVKTFDDQFFEDIYKMRRWTWTEATRRPGVVGQWIKDIVYDRLAPITPKLEELNPKNTNGNRPHKHHQFLSREVGLPKLKEHLFAVHTLAVVSDYDWNRFMANLDKSLPSKNKELFLDFYN